MQQVSCNFCSSTAYETLFTGPDLLLKKDGAFTLVRCDECGLIYQNPRLNEVELAPHYPEDYHPFHTDSPEDRVAELSEQHDMTRRFKRVMNHAGQAGKILDVGCATGQFLNQMATQGWSAVGVEPSEFAAEYARQTFGLDVRTTLLEDAGFAADEFDALTMWDVFEHVTDPLATLTECERILKPGGLVVLHLPNPECVEARAFGPNWLGWDQPRHLHLFSVQMIKKYFARTGFEFVAVESFSGRLFATLLSVEFALTKRNVPEKKYRPYLDLAYSFPFRAATYPLYKLGETFNLTTSMTIFGRKLQAAPR